jgi:predicted  nucleic acid-binding Zn-ribbon protein
VADDLTTGTKVGVGGAIVALFASPYLYRYFKSALAEWRRVRAERKAERDAHLAELRKERDAHLAELRKQVGELQGQMAGLRHHYEERLDELNEALQAEIRARGELERALDRERAEHKRTRDHNAELSGEISEQKNREAALEARLMARIRELESELRGRDKAMAEMLSKAIETVLSKREGV